MSDSEDPAEKTERRYRAPPIEHRFRKGVSGNPRGRPHKARALVPTQVDGRPGLAWEDRVKSLAIEEAYRTITIREGDRVERIPIIQVILRKLAVAAANGNSRAQQAYLNLLIGAEADRRAATAQLLTTAIEYKEHWHQVLAKRARDGTTGPEPVTHPDDVIIDYATGDVRIEGPILEEQKEAMDQLRSKWPEMQQSLTQINEQIELDPNNLELRKEQKVMTKVVRALHDDARKRFVRDALASGPLRRSNKD